MPIYTIHQIYHTSGAALRGVVYKDLCNIALL